MITKRTFSATKAKKYADEGVEDVVDVKVLDENGEPKDEKELTKEEIQFAARVAGKVYKKFAASKKIKFSSEDEEIEVTVPEDLPEDAKEVDEMAEDQANQIVEDKLDEQNPDEVTVDVTLPNDEETEPTESTDDDDQATEAFCNGVSPEAVAEPKKEFSTEDSDNLKVDLSVREMVDDPEIEVEEPKNVEETPDGTVESVGDAEKKTFAASNRVMNKMFGRDGVTDLKTKFFASQLRRY